MLTPLESLSVSVNSKSVNPKSVNPKSVKHNPWDRLPGEQDAAWQAFRRYRDMPSSKRNLTALQTILTKERNAAEDAGEFDNVPTIRYGTLNDWAKEYNWVQRTAAWDAEIDRVWQEESKLAIREAARRHWESSIELQNIGKLALKFVDPATLAEKAPQEVRRFIETGIDLERKTLGMDAKEDTEHANSAILVIQVVEQLEKQLMSKEASMIDGEFKEVTTKEAITKEVTTEKITE